ncbi:hypothetical protein [Enterococcus sp.]|uniref:hypothetical protein n=1 Tax=Enterococcus sp. TaxID=35783 RepID=UPI002FCA397C
MDRKLERIMMRIGGGWNIVNGLLTMFIYSPWVKNDIFTNMSGDTIGLNFLSENLNVFVMTYSLLFIAIGVFNLYLSTRMFNDDIAIKIPIWLITFGIISYLSVDIISATLFIVSGVISLSKNKALKLKYQ